MLVLGLSSKCVRVIIHSLLLVVSLLLLAVVLVDVHSTVTAVGSKRASLVEAVAIEAVATPSVRHCEYATRSRQHAGSTSAFWLRLYFVDVLKCGAIKENAAQSKFHLCCVNVFLGIPRSPFASYSHLSGCRRSTLAPSLRSLLVASKLVPTPLFLLLRVALPCSPAEDSIPLQSYRHTHFIKIF